MIAHLRGKLLAKRPNQAIVECAGVGYDVTISVPTFSELGTEGAEASLYVHTHVREDALSLYGFVRPEEKLLFERLLMVSGIGPKLAITVLSMAALEVVGAIRGCRQENGRTDDPRVERQARSLWSGAHRDKPEPSGRRCDLGAGEPGISEGGGRARDDASDEVGDGAELR